MPDYLVYSRLQTIHNRHTSQQAAPPDTTLSHWTHTISTHKANDLGIMSSLVTYRSSCIGWFMMSWKVKVMIQKKYVTVSCTNCMDEDMDNDG